MQLLPGDVLIMGSDGLWDNVDDNEILDLVLTVRLCQSSPSSCVLKAYNADQKDVNYLQGAPVRACVRSPAAMQHSCTPATLQGTTHAGERRAGWAASHGFGTEPREGGLLQQPGQK